MTNEEIRDKILDMVAERMNKPADMITMDKHFINDLGADSLEVIELSMALEDEFGIKIPDDDAEKVQTVGAAIDYVTNAVAQKAAASK